MSGKKQTSAIGQLGIDVRVTNKSLGVDPWAGTMLERIAKAFKPDNHEYIGSFATHIYRTGEVGKEMSFMHHTKFIKIPGEKFVSIAVSDLGLHLMTRLFGRKKPGTRDPKDLRT